MRSNINVPEIHNFIATTHETNRKRLLARLAKGEWHWMFPDNWKNTPENRSVLFHALNSSLLPKPKYFGSAGK